MNRGTLNCYPSKRFHAYITHARANRLLKPLAASYFPWKFEIRSESSKFRAKRVKCINPIKTPAIFSWFQSRGAGRQIASVCETDFAPGIGGCVSVILSDLLLFSCLAAFYTGIVLAIASLLN